MIFNYIKIAFRNFRKRKPYFLINLFGLAIGMSAFMLLKGYTHFEKSYEDVHEQRDHIYTIVMSRFNKGELIGKHPSCPPGLATTIKDHTTGIKYVTRYRATRHPNFVRNASVALKEKSIFYVDPDFLNMFSVTVVKRNKEKLLDTPFTMLITEEIAKKYFGNSDPIGKKLRVGNKFNNNDFTIEGVVKKLPNNTDVQFDFLVSFESAFYKQKWFENNWSWWGFTTFVRFEDHVNPVSVKQQMPAYIEKYKPHDVDKNHDWEFDFLALGDIHLHSSFRNKAINPDKNYKKVKVLEFIGLLILLISWVNFINLSTATAAERAKEVVVRKVLGSKKVNITQQFLIEVLLLNSAAFLLAIGIMFVVLRYFNTILKIDSLHYFITHPLLLFSVLSIIAVGAIISGLYPAWLISSFSGIQVLKQKVSTSKTSAWVRKCLVGVQFSISMILISVTVIMLHQQIFMTQRDHGITIEDKLIVSKPRFPKWKEYRNNFESFRDQLKKIEGIKEVSASDGIPTIVANGLAAWQLEKGMETQKAFSINGIDPYYFPSYEVEFIAGRNFTTNHKTNPNEVILFDSVRKDLGYKTAQEAIGRKIGLELYKKPLTVVGVIKDYEYATLKYQSRGMLFTKHIGPSASPKYFSVQLDGSEKTGEVIKEIKEVFDTTYPGDVFETILLKDEMESKYINDKREINIFKVFSAIAILLAIVGVVGLASFIAQLKIREVSIRKVLGASSKDISWLLSKEFLSVVLISILVVIPIAFYLMQQWLLDYHKRISIAPWHFLIAIVLVMSITSVVVIFNLLKVVQVTPAKTLKASE